MAECTTLYAGVINDYYGSEWELLCCYTQPSQTYDDFLTGLTETYDNYCLKDRVFADYVTQLYNNCLSGVSSAMTGVYVTGGTANGTDDKLIFTNSSGGTFTVANSALLFNDAYVSGGTLNVVTGCVTFGNTSGGTFEVCGFSGFTSYWSANTDGSISTSGVTEVKISADTMVEGDVALETLSAIGGSISINSAVYQNDNFTIQNGKILRAYGDVYLGNQATDVTTVSGDIGISGDTNINGIISGNTNARFGGILGVSGNTFLGGVGAATPTSTDKILIVQSGGLVESITTAQLTGFTADYWVGNGSGTGIKPSGTTTNVDVTGSLGVSGTTYSPNLSSSTVTIQTELNVTGNTFINGTLSAMGNTTLNGVTGISGRTYLGTIDAAGASYSNDKILVAQSNGEVEYLTTAELKQDIADADYWTANTDGSISTSGVTDVKISGDTFNKGNLGVSGKTFLGSVDAATPTTTDKILIVQSTGEIESITTAQLTGLTEQITEVTAGTGLDGGGTTGNVTVNVDYTGTDNFIDAATNLESTAIAAGDTIVYHDEDDNNVKKGFVSDLPFTNNSGTMSSWKIGSTTGTDLAVSDGETVDVVGGTGISGSVGGTRTVTLNLDDTAVTPNTYTNTTITVDQQGRLTSAASGTDADYWSANTDSSISTSGVTNVKISGDTFNKGNLGVSGRTFLGTVDTATATATDKILVVQSTGEIESITTASLTAFTSDYWVGDGTGTGIKPSGVTTNVTVDGNIHGNSNLRIDQLVHFNTASTSANTYIGYQAGNPGINDTLQQYNTAIGHQALANQTGGGDVDENVAVGYRSLYSVSSGEWNTAVGTNTAKFITTTDGNTAIGNKALGGTPAVGGAYNIAIGYMSAYNVKGSGNLFFGVGAGSGNNSGTATGSNNVGIGDYAVGGGSIAGTGTLTSGDYNFGLGSKSLQNITSGDYNIAIGGQAGDNITSGDYNILIGASQDPASGTADYQMNIGGIIYGKDLTSSSSINAVGIGIVSPTAKLHVDGTTILTGELGVSGDTNINGVISGNTHARFGGVLGVSGRTFLGTIDAATPTASDKVLIIQSTGEIESITTTQLTGLTDGLFWTANTDGSISNSGLTGHVGVGTDTPNKPLTVVGDISGTTALYLGNATNFISGETAATGDLSIHSGDDIELYSGDDIVLNATSKIKFTQLNAAQPSLQIDLNDNAGTAFLQNGTNDTVIAIDDANQRLYFYDIGGEYIVSDGTDLTIASGVDIILNPTAHAGIGISAPTTKLHIVDTGEGEDPLRVQTVQAGNGYMLLIQDDGVVKKSEKVIVTSTGDVGISGNTNINGLLSADTNVIVHGVLGVSGATNVHGELSAATNVHVKGVMGISGKTNMSDSLLMATDKKVEFSTTDEHIVSDGTDLTIASGAKINLTATSDIVVPANVGITFGTGEKIEGDNTDLTISSGAKINLTAISDVHIPKNVGLVFDDNASEKIEGDNTDLTISSGAKINLTATSDIHVPVNVGVVFGTGEKIEGDNTDLTITSGGKINLTATGAVTTGELLDVVGEDPRVRLYADAGDHPGFELYDATTRKWIIYNDPDDSHNLNIKGPVDIVSITQTGNVGIGTKTPVTALDVHHDPTGLATHTGGGEVVTFGSGTLVKGKLHYMNTSGAWILTNANTVGLGSSELIGIALGTSVSAGVLLRGFFDMTSFLGPGGFAKGVPLYVSGTVGSIAVTQPSGANDFVRVVGYCTNTANVIYFNPDGTYIKIA